MAVNILERAGESLGGSLPGLAGAIVLLVVGLLAARLVRRLLVRGLTAAGLDGLAERWGIHDVLTRVGLERSLARLIGTVARVGISVVVVIAALSLLGLEFLSRSLNEAVLFLPKLLTAVALVVAGLVVGELARRQVDRAAGQMDFPAPLGIVVEALVVSVFAVTALAQVGIPTAVLMMLVGVLLAAAALTFALAFGLGSREVAREISSRRYVSGAFEVGQEISLGDIRGEISEFESASTVLRAADGRTLRIPNHVMLESIVTVHSPPDSA